MEILSKSSSKSSAVPHSSCFGGTERLVLKLRGALNDNTILKKNKVGSFLLLKNYYNNNVINMHIDEELKFRDKYNM